MKLDLLDVIELSAGLVIVCIVICIVSLSSCGKPPGPTPDPAIDFEVTGKTLIQGKLKPGAAVSIAEAKRSLQVAVDLIDAAN